MMRYEVNLRSSPPCRVPRVALLALLSPYKSRIHKPPRDVGRMADILRARYCRDQQPTVRAVGGEFCISGARAQRIEQDALDILRSPLRIGRLADFGIAEGDRLWIAIHGPSAPEGDSGESSRNR